MTATRWFLALCVLAFLVACGGDNGSGQDVADDTSVGTDSGTDSTPNPDVVECVPSYYIRSAAGTCIPPTDTSDPDSTAMETEEEDVASNVCSEWMQLEGTQWACASSNSAEILNCSQMFTVEEFDGVKYCYTGCSDTHLYGSYVGDMRWSADKKSYAIDLTEYTLTCTLKEE